MAFCEEHLSEPDDIWMVEPAREGRLKERCVPAQHLRSFATIILQQGRCVENDKGRVEQVPEAPTLSGGAALFVRRR